MPVSVRRNRLNSPRSVNTSERKQKAPSDRSPTRLFKKSGNTYFRTFGTIIGSECLTTVFGMGTGVTTTISSPEKERAACRRHALQFCCGIGTADKGDKSPLIIREIAEC